MSSATVRNVPLLDDDTVPFGEEEELGQTTKTYTHPFVTFFHLFFRGAAVLVYILCGWFSNSFITSFVLVVLLLSADFWTVKNITGRLLVGLRWWNYVDDEGKSHWVFESKKGTYLQGRVNPNEARIFWLALVLFPIAWCLFFIIALIGLNFKWLLLVLIALALTGANLYGYVKCNFGANKDFNSAATDFVRTQIFKNAVDLMTKPSQPAPTRPTGVV
uniref:Golgi apparatus membrane protein TVP23 homolog n=1 Tax=Tabanus bromius TaxID=304241 RepID=A0A0K8TNT8_TABBR